MPHPHAPNGRPTILSDAKRDDLVRCTNSEYLECNPWTMTEIKARIGSVDRQSIDPNAILHMLHRDPRVKACRGRKMEEGRLGVSSENFKAYFH
jgi:hypothetical protein